MARFVATIKAIITRVVFAAHGFIGIWQVTIFKKNSFYWYLSSPILLLFFEGIFTLTIKQNQEWKWFCPSVFLYLASIVPAIWLLELDKVDKRMKAKEELEIPMNFSADSQLKDLHNLIGVGIKLPDIPLSTETWITLIEQFLMLILIIGRWMLPKGDLTRDQLSQLLLVYIGTAADIIEFFDSFKDDKIAAEPILVLLTLAIWYTALFNASFEDRVTQTGLRAIMKHLQITKPLHLVSVDSQLSAYASIIGFWVFAAPELIKLNSLLPRYSRVIFSCTFKMTQTPTLTLVIYGEKISTNNVQMTFKADNIARLSLGLMSSVFFELLHVWEDKNLIKVLVEKNTKNMKVLEFNAIHCGTNGNQVPKVEANFNQVDHKKKTFGTFSTKKLITTADSENDSLTVNINDLSKVLRSESCCTIDVWGIALNITLQDAPFLVFRLLLITHFKIISYMNVFFTCKNTLVILLQIYRLYVVHSEHTKKNSGDVELTNISIISKGDLYGGNRKCNKKGEKESRKFKNRKVADFERSTEGDDSDDAWKNKKKIKSLRKDTGYSTGSSHTSNKRLKKSRSKSREEDRSPADSKRRSKHQKLKRTDRETKGRKKLEEALSEESESDEYRPTKEKEKRTKERPRNSEKKSYEREITLSVNTSDASSE